MMSRKYSTLGLISLVTTSRFRALFHTKPIILNYTEAGRISGKRSIFSDKGLDCWVVSSDLFSHFSLTGRRDIDLMPIPTMSVLQQQSRSPSVRYQLLQLVLSRTKPQLC